MKTNFHSTPIRRSEQGSTVLVVLALLGIMLALIAANAMSVKTLKGEIQLLDRKQQHRWSQSNSNR
jgi:hypothetical protein